MIKMAPRIPDPAEIAEVDGFERDPETPQHNGVQRWRLHEREKREREEVEVAH
jgi:hypothetical protein